MIIRASSVRLEGSEDEDGLSAWLDSDNRLYGYAASVRAYPEYHVVLVVRDLEGRTYLMSLPSEDWKKDVFDAGYEILFEVKK